VNPAGIPTSNCDPTLLSKVIFVGPGTDNPDKTLIPQKGQFSPALGASWQLPWFGEGKTTIRGGFQRTYGRPGTAYSGGLLSGPGAQSGSGTDLTQLNSIFATRAANLTDLPLAVPSAPTRTKPEDLTYRIGSRNAVLSGFNSFARFDPDYRIPHTDNWTLTVTRSLSRNFTLEVRNVNTIAKDQAGAGSTGTFDINTNNVYHNPELFDALERTRRGEDAVLFDQMLMGVNFANTTGYGNVGTCVTQAAGSTDPRQGQGGCAANQVLQRGSAHIRRALATAGSLANGDYVTVANALLGGGTTPGLQALPIDPSTGIALATSQRLLRNGCDRLANPTTAALGFANPTTGSFIGPRCFPENYMIANSQWSGAAYATNIGYNNYNSLEVQITMRPLHGFSMQSTYGFSKTMNQASSNFTDPLRPELDYGRSGNSVGSEFRTNGTFELPIGPNKLLLGNSSGWAARLMERWQMGFIYNISEGAPRNFGGPSHLYANGRPNIVGPWTNPEGKVQWNGQNGSYFQERFATYQDPQCTSITTLDNLQASCSLRGFAYVVPQGTPGAILLNATTQTYGLRLLENPNPGQQGTLGQNTLHTFPRWRLDGNLSKTFRISESKSAQLRVDATNIFNHPTAADPTLGFSDNFGLITTKTGSRTFQARLRLSF
jgi:hypothetical protein